MDGLEVRIALKEFEEEQRTRMTEAAIRGRRSERGCGNQGSRVRLRL